jgi:hypothetical protein
MNKDEADCYFEALDYVYAKFARARDTEPHLPPVQTVRYCRCGRRLGTQDPGFECSSCKWLFRSFALIAVGWIALFLGAFCGGCGDNTTPDYPTCAELGCVGDHGFCAPHSLCTCDGETCRVTPRCADLACDAPFTCDPDKPNDCSCSVDGKSQACEPTASNPPPEPPNQPLRHKLVVLAGQSNAFGTGSTNQLTSHFELRDPYPAVELHERWHIGQPLPDPMLWTDRDGPLQSRGAVEGQPANQFGPELSMMRVLDAAEPNTWAIVKVVVGGTSLATDWRVDGNYPSDENLFNQLCDEIAQARFSFDADIAAIVWVQGGTDASALASANAYAANESAFVTELRARFGTFRFVFDRLSAQTNEPYTEVVRAQQAQVAASIADVVMVDSDDLPMVSPHYTADGLAALGERFAGAIH